MKFWRNFPIFSQIMLWFEEKYGQFAKFRKFPQKIWKKSGIGENFHFSFHYFIRVLGAKAQQARQRARQEIAARAAETAQQAFSVRLDRWNFRRGPRALQARKLGKIYEINSTSLPLIIQNLQFLWISKDLWQFIEILRKFHLNRFEKRRIWTKKMQIFQKFTKKSRNFWRDFAKFLDLKRCRGMQIL